MRCSCCNREEGDMDGGYEVDRASGLCLACQPCPYCLRFATECTDFACDPIGQDDHPPVSQALRLRLRDQARLPWASSKMIAAGFARGRHPNWRR